MTRINWLHATLMAWLGVLLLRLVPVGGDWRTIDVYTWVVIVVWIASYVVGYSAVPPARTYPPWLVPAPPGRWFARWIFWLSVFSMIGAALIAYEFAIKRAYGFTTPVALIRAAEVGGAMEGGAGGSWISGIGRLLTPALLVAWILALFCRERLRRRTWLILISGTLIVFWEQAMFEGGRFFLAALVISCVTSRLLRPFPGSKNKRTTAGAKRWFHFAAVLIPVVILFGYVFVDRVRALDLDFQAAYSMFVTSFSIDPTEAAQARLDSGASAVWFAGYMFWMYVSQGPNEFDRLLHHEPLEHAFGLVQFPQMGQGLSKLSGMDISYDQYTNMPNAGTYTTIIGPNYMDVGIVGAWIVALVLGWLTARCAQRLRRGMLHRMGLAAPLVLSVSLFSPIVSLIVNVWPAFVWACLIGATARYQLPVRHRD